ncbi:hypothetical protein TIFTF001_024501 [Ficus carica]|uniref:Uncharacterized protein n=1 Tax=Ficus carica TaxID=3494 RepID=A0AA88AVR5_FICCA|nr:hypothetical protein TIFTF001_024501 [Ficus carica]
MAEPLPADELPTEHGQKIVGFVSVGVLGSRQVRGKRWPRVKSFHQRRRLLLKDRKQEEEEEEEERKKKRGGRRLRL